MNILIFGATGLLGYELVEFLAKEHQLYLVVKHAAFQKKENINIIQMNLLDFDENKLPNDIDCIYYLVQAKNFRDVPNAILDIFKLNVEVPVRIAKWAIDKHIKKFIFYSSGGVINQSADKMGFYLDSKLSTETFLRNYADYFEIFIIMRPFFIYGPKQEKTMLIRRLFESIKNQVPITLNGENGISINPIFVQDAALISIAALNLTGYHILNLAGNETVTIRQISTMIADIVKSTPNFNFCENVANNLIGNIDSVSSLLMKPVISLSEGLRLSISQWNNDV